MGIGRFVTHTMFGWGASDYGAVPVPGSQQFELPAGKVYLTYQESKKSKASPKDDFAMIDVMFAAPHLHRVLSRIVSGRSMPNSDSTVGLMSMSWTYPVRCVVPDRSNRVRPTAPARRDRQHVPTAATRPGRSTTTRHVQGRRVEQVAHQRADVCNAAPRRRRVGRTRRCPGTPWSARGWTP